MQLSLQAALREVAFCIHRMSVFGNGSDADHKIHLFFQAGKLCAVK